MRQSTKTTLKKILIGIGALIVFIIIANQGSSGRHFQSIVFSWMTVVIAIGTYMLIKKRDKKIAIGLIAIGVFFLLPGIYFIVYGIMNTLWPLVATLAVIIVIIALSKNHFFSSFSNKSLNTVAGYSEDVFEAISIFGTNNQNIVSQKIRNGKIISIFGTTNINFINCEIEGNYAILDILVVFGEAKISIPKNWDVRIETTAIFGSFEDKRTDFNTHLSDNRKTLIIKGIVSFGGGQLKIQ